MASTELQQVIELIESRPEPSEDATLNEIRADTESFLADCCPALPGTRVEPVVAGGAPAEWVTAPDVEPVRSILYLHGGAYVVGSPASHRGLTSRISRHAAARVLALDYRMAPEQPFPAAVEDAVAAYRWLLEAGTPASEISIVGDSAGGGLTISTLVQLRDLGMDLPAAAAVMSPWTDLSCDTESFTLNGATDPMIDQEGLSGLAQMYLNGRDADEPLASPIHADLSGLPPLLIQVGEAEKLRDDAVRLTECARDAGVDVTLERWDDMLHVWHMFPNLLPEAQQAIEGIAVFLRDRAASGQESVVDQD